MSMETHFSNPVSAAASSGDLLAAPSRGRDPVAEFGRCAGHIPATFTASGIGPGSDCPEFVYFAKGTKLQSARQQR